MTATEVSFSPGTYEVLQGSHTVADALDLLGEYATQGNDFCLALLRLFGRGVVCGVVPSITASAPARGSTDVPIEITVSDGTVVDGRGCVVTLSNLPALQTTVPGFESNSVAVEVKQWLYS